MELELDLNENQAAFWLAVVIILLGLAFGLVALGRPLTPYTGNTARVMGWTDWQYHKEAKLYNAEIDVLREDAGYLVEALNGRNNAVQVSLLVKRIREDVGTGVPALAAARQSLYQAALNVGDWSIGILPREDAIASLELALSLLEEER